MTDSKPTVLIIDDDSDLRASIARLLRSLDMNTKLFASIPDFLKSDPPDGPSCLVLDVRLPGQSGLDLQRELAAANRELPIIFITGHGDIPMTVQAMKGGAIEFLTKPFRDQDLLDAIQLAGRHVGNFFDGGEAFLHQDAGDVGIDVQLLHECLAQRQRFGFALRFGL